MGSDREGSAEATPATVLVVDDNPAGLVAIEGILRGDGYEIVTAGSGGEALETAEEILPDLVLLDVLMPDMDGYQVCAKIRESEVVSEIPVVMVTALDDRSSRLAAIEAGADDFLTKPIDRAELRARVRNVTELNRYRKLSAARSRLDRLISTSPDGIVVLDGDGIVLLANPAFRELVGGEEGGVVGRSIWRHVPEEAEEQARAFHSRVRDAARHPRQTELHLHGGSDRDPVPVEISASPFEWDDGGVAEQWIVRDVRERKQMEAQLNHAQRFEAIARLTGAIAHDFNNYLTAIVTPADLILRTEDLAPEVREDVKGIHAAGTRAASLCKQLLSFSRKRIATPRLVDVNEVVSGVEPVLARLVRGGVELGFDLWGEPLLVRIDPTHLEQVVVNLVVNARDAMPDGGRVLISTAFQPSDRPGSACRVVLRVRDDGVGMDRDTREKLFDPFFTTKEDGTGLGLSTVHGIVTQAGGEITVDSDPGAGTRFEIFLPPAFRGEIAEERRLKQDDDASRTRSGDHVVEPAGPFRRPGRGDRPDVEDVS